MGKKRNILFTLMIVFLLITSGCKSKDNEVKLDFNILGVKEIMTNFYGIFCEAIGDNVYLYFVRSPICKINFDTKEEVKIGKIGNAPGEYLLPSDVIEYKGLIYIGDISSSQLQAFKPNGEFVNNIGKYIIKSKFVFCNDTLLVAENSTLNNNYFITYNIKNGKGLKHFGKFVEYPISRMREKLHNKGKAKPGYREWDAKDSILVAYDYYHDKFRVYNIYTGKVINTFGRLHRGWSIPKTHYFQGDKYHGKSLMIYPTPCVSVVVTKKYIYAFFKKGWEYGWKYDWGWHRLSPNKLKRVLTNKYYFVDVYKREDFEYIGTIYPLDKYMYKNEKYLWVCKMTCDGDSILNFYLQRDKFLRKVSIYIPTLNN